MFEGGTDFKHVRQAKNRLIGMYSAAAGNDNMVMRGRIMDTFDELKAENQKRTNAQIDAAAESDRSVAGNFGRMFLMTAGGMGTYDPEAYQAQAEKLVDVVGESKVAKDRFAVIDAPAKMLSDAYENGKTSAITKAEATELYASIIERDGNGNITPESEARAKQKLIDSGATGYMAESIAIETAAANGEDTSALYQSMIDNGADPEMARTAMLRYNATSHEAAPKKDPRLLAASEDDMRELIAIFRANVTADGTMTDYEVDQAFRANGYSNCLDPAESAAHYFVEVDFGRSLMATGTDEEKAAWQAATPQEQRAIATESMESWNDETRTAYTGWFVENQMVNPDVAKTVEEVQKYQGIAAVVTKATSGIVSGAVNFADMAIGAFQGRSERWQFTEEVTDFTNFITNYGRSNQSYLTEGIGLASDMGAEVLRMYMLNAAGAAIGSAAGATKVGTAVSAVAESGKVSRGMRFLANAGMYAVRSSPFVLTATGNYYSEAMEAGATAQQATWYAIVCGALEGGLEQLNVDQWVSKGLGGRKVAEQLINGGTKAMRSGMVNAAKLISLASSFCGEFTEESLSYVAMFVAGIIYESWLGLLFSVPMLVLHTAAFIGFLKWRYYGVMCFLAGSLLALIFELVAVTEESGNALPVLISGFIYLATMVVYYSKREPLFEKSAPKAREEGTPADVATDAGLPADSTELTDQRDEPTCIAEAAPRSRFHDSVIRFWKYGAVAAASLVIGIMLGFLVFQGRMISLKDEVDELEEKYESFEKSDALELYNAERNGYRDGLDDGYDEGYAACDADKEDQYQIGYDFAMESAVSGMRIYKEAVQAAIFYNDRQTLSYLMTLDFEHYLGE